MDATRSPGHFHRLLRLLRTPVHLPAWGKRAAVRRTAGNGQSVMAPLAGAPAAEAPRRASASMLMPLDSAAAPLRAAAAARPATASAASSSSRMTRSLEEVRADLARMREQARLRAEASQVQAQASARAQAQLQATARARRENAYAPTDFMEITPALARPQPASQTSFARTDFLDFDGRPMGSVEVTDDTDSADFEATAFQSPAFLSPRGNRAT